MTPTDDATISPIERVIARPGTYLDLSHTLKGPKCSPTRLEGPLPGMILDCSTRPLVYMMRSASSFSLGLWSLLRAVHVQVPSLFCSHIIARESPELAQRSTLLYMIIDTAVVPLNVQSILELPSSLA